MSFRICCDEHVPPQTADYLEKDGREVTTVVDTLGSGTDGRTIADWSVQNNFAVLTNDADFLNRTTFPELCVLDYPASETTAFELATAIADVAQYYESVDELPKTVFL